MMVTPFEIAPGIRIGGGSRPVYIAGPCVVESQSGTIELARRLAAIAARHAVPLLFKSSFDKANRSSLSSYRGPGIEAGLATLRAVREETGLPLLTDVHEPSQVGLAAAVADVLQVPAFLCRQTDLLVACGRERRRGEHQEGPVHGPRRHGQRGRQGSLAPATSG